MTRKLNDNVLTLLFAVAILTMPIWIAPLGASYPDLLQRFAIFGVFAIGFNILFGLTGYLSFGHAAFLGAGSYAAVWSFKLFTMNIIPAVIFGVAIAGILGLIIGYVSLRRSGIYFSILTLAFAQMSYNLAYSVLVPITNGETGLQVRTLAAEGSTQSWRDADIRVLDQLFGIEEIGIPVTNLFGMKVSGWEGFYVCAIILIIMFYVSVRIFRSPFGLMLMAVKSNQNRLNYTGINTRPYTLAAFVISAMYAGLAGTMMAFTDPLAGAERMQWTASGEIVLMTILGGVGTLIGPIIGAAVIKYLEQIFSAINISELEQFWHFLPEGLRHFVVEINSLFVGGGWELTLGLMFMLIVIFLPGGIMEGFRRIGSLFTSKSKNNPSVSDGETQPAE